MHLVLVIRCAIIAPTGQHSVARGNTPGIANDKNLSPRGAAFMSQSLSQVLVHLIFSTKNREAWLSEEIRNELDAYIGGIVNAQNGILLQAGSVEDHIHLLPDHPRTISPANLVQEIKTGSSKWIKTKDVRFTKFAW